MMKCLFKCKSNHVRIVLLLILALLFTCVPAYAAQFTDTLEDTVLLAITDYGWVSFDIVASYSETYSTSGSVITLSSRKNKWDVTASRSGSGAIPRMSIKVSHYNGNGSEYTGFDMTPPDGNYDITFHGILTNSQPATYSITSGKYGKTSFGLGAPGMWFPYTYNDFHINFGTG